MCLWVAGYPKTPGCDGVWSNQNHADVFVRGTDGNVYHKGLLSTQWIPSVDWWEPLGPAQR
jgi:hypothetical protein